MRIRIRPVILLLISSLLISALVACIGINKTKQNMAVYDFGLFIPTESSQQITSKILVDEPVAAEPLNHNKMRYRLNYQNPLRVFYYSESRWASKPSELFSSKLSQMVNLPNNPTNCSLKLKIEAFDHVFQTAATSDGVVQMSALVVDRKSKKIVSSQLITESATSPSPNAQGGAIALQQASENALKKVINWGNMMADDSELCR